MKSYDHQKIESKWGKSWNKNKIYKTPDKKKGAKNFYTLVEFPYPSGNLHVGHWYAFAVPDIFARYKRMKGSNVLFPIGFDAFGLPAENAAIKRGLNPRKWTEANISHMKKQLESMGASFDWSREVQTCNPNHYKWTQWLFLKLFEKGLIYQKETPANWCPGCKTVLANEQVKDGVCERCGSEVEKKDLLQWNVKITDYAERLLKDLEKLDWPEPIKESQRNWIGKSEGAEIDFRLTTSSVQPATVKIFTTRPDTIFGATYIVLAPENREIPNYKNQITNWEEVQKYIEISKRKTEIERTAEGKEKTGVELKGIKAINPANKEEIPIYVADYVLPNYGTGAIMAVPAHDKRDYDFAKKFNLPIKMVVEPKFISTSGEDMVLPNLEFIKRKVIGAIVRNPKNNKYLCISWKGIHMNGLVTGGIDEGEDVVEAARREVLEETGYKNLKLVRNPEFAIHSLFYHRVKKINRWARIQYIFFDLVDEEKNNVNEKEAALHEVLWKTKNELRNFFSVIEGEFLLNLLDDPDYIYTGGGALHNSGRLDWMDSEKARDEIIKLVGGKKKTSYKLRDWTVSRQRYWGTPIPIIHCEKCGTQAVPEKDLPVKLPEIKDYLPRDDGKSPLAKTEKWVSVKCPKCKGKAQRETDTLDTFVDSSWYFLRYTDPQNKKEFASKKKMADWMPVDFYSGGAEHTTMHLLYSRFWQKALYDLKLVKDNEPYKKRTNRGLILGPDGNKMSKSRGNVIDPDEIVKNLGADTVRTYLAFIGPFNEIGSYPWSTDGIVGIKRFLERVWNLYEKIETKEKVRDEILLNQTIKKVGEDIENLKMNTAVSQLMIFSNALSKREKISKKEYEILLILLSPFAPFLTEELWSKLGNKKSIHLSKWPEFKNIKSTGLVKIMVQIDGKIRDTMEIEEGESEESLKNKALDREAVRKWIADKRIEKVIYVKNKILSVVTK